MQVLNSMSAEGMVFWYVKIFSVMAPKFRASSTTIIRVELVKYVEALYTNSHVVISQSSVTLFIFYTLMQITDRERVFHYASGRI